LRSPSPFRLHRWLAVPMGIILIGWLSTGIVMLFPGPTPDALLPFAPEDVDYAAATISPAEATARVQEEMGAEAARINLALRTLQGRVVYEVRPDGAETRLVDGQSGDIITITPELARTLAAARLRPEASITDVELLDHHDSRYRTGPIPVYRAQVDVGPGTLIYVSAVNGSVIQASDRWTMVRAAFLSIHTFGTLRLAFGPGAPSRELLVVAALTMMCVVATGYTLAWKVTRGWRRHEASR
jgi:uncharacterized iron-regulated membrane protein